MSRVAKSPITIPTGVEVKLTNDTVSIKGGKGELSHRLHSSMEVKADDNVLTVTARDNTKTSGSMAGTTRAILNNMVNGVHTGFEKNLKLVGVGYRVQAKGNTVNLTIGFSHPVEFKVPEGISIETPSQTEILIKGCDKQRVGQVAANIRSYRPPEPYKGKGIRYSDEIVVRKEAKKK